MNAENQRDIHLEDELTSFEAGKHLRDATQRFHTEVSGLFS